MPDFTYIVPLVSTPESNETLIAKKVIRVLDCSINLGDDDLCNMWSFTKCPSDRDYCNPYVPGDIIYLQKKVGAGRSEGQQTFSFPKVINTVTGQEIPNPETYLTTEFGVDKNLNKYLNMIVDTSALEGQCFYLSLKYYSCSLKGDKLIAFNQCVADLVSGGKTETEAQEICLASYCEPVTAFSEPYCKVDSCINTIVLEGVYTNYDCDGNFYGPFLEDAPNSFRLMIRTYGEVAPSQFDIVETLINEERRSTRLTSSYTMWTKLVPYYVARRIAVIFAAMKVYIDDIEYRKTTIVPKGTERGQMWQVTATIIRQCDETDFTCE